MTVDILDDFIHQRDRAIRQRDRAVRAVSKIIEAIEAARAADDSPALANLAAVACDAEMPGWFPTFQSETGSWMMACFTDEICDDVVERCDRLLEEVFETLQALHYDPARIAALQAYVWGRPVGELPQEIGGVMVCVAALGNAVKVDVDRAARTELIRCWANIAKIRAKHAAKPTGSALPIAAPAAGHGAHG